MSQGIFRRIFQLAEQLEPNRTAVWDWLLHTHIDGFDGHTALEMVFADQGEQVVDMLEAALHDEDDKVLLGPSLSAPRRH
ncbi:MULTISPECIES: hypothetical protein [unclassified Dyella]|uniref:hypothetical protein n=1 Tax=unclassified Dyella TaxID=2634549 RepID=UPI000C82501D|nr:MULTISPECIES: hypothetical protein [unclassified Dyella]MDR3447858.1 hypothetical protein [Dyella sp.]PMQ03456.1 hypothetical protein DyAD56_19505 [Dyella sp. AD56]